MAIREYECERHGYICLELPRTAERAQKCPRPRCGKALVRVYSRDSLPTVSFSGSMASSGGIPDFYTSESEYCDWQQSEIKRAKDDLHPDNARGYVSPDRWQPKARADAIREKNNRRAKGELI